MDKQILKKKLQRYTGVATALLGAHTVDGQVQYVDIPDTTLNTNGAQFDLNIDQDTNGLVDYRIIQYVDTTQFKVSGSFIQARGPGRNQVVGLDYANYYYPFKLDLGNEIGPDTIFGGLGTSRNWGQLALEINDTTYPNDQFKNGVTDGFIGLRFRATVNDTLRTYYGWLRVDLAADHRSITIKDYAYQTIEDSSLFAGEGSPLSLPEVPEPVASLQQSGQFIQVEFPQEQVQQGVLRLRDISGRVVKQWTVGSGNNRFSLSGLPKGILTAELETEGYVPSIKVLAY